jgi:hypothetical protein
VKREIRERFVKVSVLRHGEHLIRSCYNRNGVFTARYELNRYVHLRLIIVPVGLMNCRRVRRSGVKCRNLCNSTAVNCVF